MRWLIAAVGALWIAVIMWDAFEAIVLPRRVTRKLRPARLFYRGTWTAWSAIGRRIQRGKLRESYLSVYGPLSLLGLLIFWAIGLIFGFAMLQWSLGSSLQAPEQHP